ncbi:hypothetical protein NW761_015000 [Fusarium oxysporum]|nr:hypothetical protein NW758_015054 [Fusarium oxysporum]KAJ4070981.1 hypothetical protein NW761_015000 [Fusarium oxysporum]KAJ4148695.1 hypothetical protein NW765_017562 [Fusarium oxysporum]KAJ4253251.1 hypothetical protein NW764_016389 [Fusarium oxysporum]
MIGSVGLPQPHSSIGASGQDTNEPVKITTKLDGMRAMSPRMASDDVEALKREIHAGLHRHAKALQDSLLLISNRIEAIKKGNERLDSNNEFLHKSIKDLTGMRWTMT